MAGTVLAIDDEPDVLELLEYNLTRDGFAVLAATDGRAGLELARKKKPDLILLDVMLPGMDGIEVCRALKASAETQAIPVLMLSARSEEVDVVLGLGVGAEDYVTKPFRPRELTARIRAALRRVRAASAPSGSLIRVGPLTIDPQRVEARTAEKDGSETRLGLTLTEFHILQLLASHPGRVFTRAQILDRIVGSETAILDRNVDVHVRGIRKKLGDHAAMLETRRGVGYALGDPESAS